MHMSPTKLKDSDECFKCSGVCLFYSDIFFAFLSNLKVAIMGQKSDEALSLLYP